MKIIPYTDIYGCPKGVTEAMTVTTNGMIKSNGHAVMGAGIAKTVDQRYHVSGTLAKHLRENGNTPADLGVHDGFHILSYPTKDDWRNPSTLQLIMKSAQLIVKLADELNLTKIYMVPPGCGLGGLNWATQVKPAIENILDDRFIVISPQIYVQRR
ncbi:MAG: hypothetical protein IKS69_00765 [Erysipelotrichaceae bacterium]|nr:hypothetical protein [Erysipelotrichaceae bacterium]